MTAARVSIFRSLKGRIIVVLATAAAISAVAAGLLFHGVTESERLVNKAQSAQERIEGYLLLTGRLNEYRSSVTSILTGPIAVHATAQQIDQVKEPVQQAFTRLLSLYASEVDAAHREDNKKRVVTKGLMLSRLKAQFDNLHLQVREQVQARRKIQRLEPALNAFGVAVAPMLAAAIEQERQLARSSRAEMVVLRSRLSLIAAGLALLSLTTAAAVYLGVGRPLIRRIGETIRGAEAISQGELGERLRPSGSDELTELMTRFNLMADSFEAREAELTAAQADLQLTVDQQTADLRQVNRRLETIDANRRQFFADVSHELRTPLTVVQGEAEFNLKAKAKPNAADMRRSFETILKRVLELRRRVDDMLRVARSESGRLDLQRGPVDLYEIAAVAVDSEARPAARRGLKLQLETGTTSLLMAGDRDWLRQIFSGLIANAIKHSPERGLVTVRCGNDGSSGWVEVEDDGPGLPDDHMERVFARFERGPEEADTEGFGIGLHLARWVVEEHGGSIALHNRQGRNGLCVRVTLPLKNGREAGES
jgi:two-component system OmpR family sensor kinase